MIDRGRGGQDPGTATLSWCSFLQEAFKAGIVGWAQGPQRGQGYPNQDPCEFLWLLQTPNEQGGAWCDREWGSLSCGCPDTRMLVSGNTRHFML